MFYLAANLLGLIGLAGVFSLTGWLFDQVAMKGRGLEPVPGAARFGLGAAIWVGWVFLLAAGQMLSAPTLGSVVVLTLATAWLHRRLSPRGLPVGPELRSTSRPDPAAWVLGGLLGAILVGLWLQVLWPQISWDANAYHLTVPRLYLEEGGFRRIPFNVYSNWPLNTQMLFAMALALKDHVLAKSVHFAFGLATFLLIYRVVKVASRPWAGWLGGALFLVNPVVLDEFRAAYVDLAFAFFFFLAFVMVHDALENSADRGRRLMVAGVFSGVAAGMKPTGSMGVLCLLVLYLVVTLRRGQKAGDVLGGLARIAVPAGLLLAPWGVKSWVLTGNPVYPFLYPVLGGPEWSADLSEQLRQWQQGIGMGRGWFDYLLLPFRVVVAGGRGYDHFDGRISPLWLAVVPMALVMGRRQPFIARSLGVAGVYFIFWALSSQQMRFLIPILPCLAVAGALALVELGRQLKATARPVFRWAVSLGMIATLAIVSSSMVLPTWVMLRRYIELGDGVREDAVHPVFRYINEELPEDAKLMFLNTNHGFFCEREFIADSFFEASQTNSLLQAEQGVSGIEKALAELEITHLLIENRDRFIPWPQSLYEFLNDPDLARPIHRTSDSVYDVVEIVSIAAPGD